MGQLRKKSIASARSVSKPSKGNSLNCGIVHIHCRRRNTLCTLTTLQGDCVASVSCGQRGFRGVHKKSLFAAKATAKAMKKLIRTYKVKRLFIRFYGWNPRRRTISRRFRWLKKVRKKVIYSIPCQPHNGCRPRKKRRK